MSAKRAAAAATYPKVLFCGGLGTTGDVLQLLQDACNRAALALGVSAVELLDWGLPGGHITVDSMTQAVAERLAEEDGPVDVISASFGGAIAQLLARYYPARVNEMVYVSTCGGFVGSRLGSPLAALKLLGKCIAQAGNGSLPIWEVMLRSAAIQTFYSWGWLDELPQETLVLHGVDDDVIPVYNAQRMARLIPNSRLGLMAGDHYAMLDDMDAFALEIVAFLRREELAPAVRPGVSRAAV